MFKWLRRNSAKSEDDERQRFVTQIDELNANAAGGPPTSIEGHLGTLKLHSGVLALGDPQYMPSIQISNIDSDEVAISARIRQYPTGQVTLIELNLDVGNGLPCNASRKIGELAIDSAKLIVADKVDIDQHWTETGQDRIGVISTAPDDTVLRQLKKRFKLDTVQVNPVRAEVVGSVSESLEQEIKAYLGSIPEYARYVFMHFYVQTNNSFDRANFMHKSWDFMPVGNDDLPLMFVGGTGRGDGLYDVNCRYSGDVPQRVSISFVEDY